MIPPTLTSSEMPAFILPQPTKLPGRRKTRHKASVCTLDPRTTSQSYPSTRNIHIHATRDLSQVPRLRLLKLSLLLSDLHFRVNTHHEHASLHPPLSSISYLSTSLLTPPPPPHSTVRQALWDLRAALEPFPVSPFTRESLELARACALHVPNAKDDELRHEFHNLAVETRLLAELKGLRSMIVDFLDAVPLQYDKSYVLEMAAELGIDEYRVRGKTRLSNAVLDLTNCQTDIPQSVREAAGRVRAVLQDSLAEDLQVSPVGEAMLLRPRVVDIPNFAVVSDSFLRGGQPNRGGLEWLQHYGVRVVVDLRGSDRGNQWLPHCRELRGIGDGRIRFCNIPVEDFCTPSFRQVDEFLRLEKRLSAGGGVMFMHCKAGIGRTGTFIACWRVSNGMDVEQALAMEQLYSEAGGGLRQEAFVREFARRWKQR